MPLNEDEFNEQFTDALDAVIAVMSETPEIEPARFFNVVCLLENLQFFGPVIFSAIKKNETE